MIALRRALLLLFLVAAGCGRDGDGPADAAPAPPPYRIPVEVYTLHRQEFRAYMEATGVIEADADITLATEVPGTVAFVAEPIGTRLQAGEAIIRLDDTDLKLTLARAEAELERAEAAYARAREDVETDTSLYEEGLTPQRQKSRMQFAEAMSRAQVNEARTARDLAARAVEKAVIGSPRDAELSDTYVDVGEWVAPGTRVARVIDVDVVTAVIYLSELDVARVRPGQDAWVSVDTYPEEPFRGAVQSVSPAATESTRTYKTEIRIPNTEPARRLLPGMAARVRIVTRLVPDALVAPLDAVAERPDGPVVYVLADGPDGPVVQAAPVRLGLRVGRRVQLLEGPPPGTRIVGASVDLVRDGQAVRTAGTGEPVESSG